MRTNTYAKTNTFIKLGIISFIIGLLVPFITHAQISITEIMYDPAGTDSKREWIEVFNSSNQDIDLTTWFFFENNVFHKISVNPSTPTNTVLAPGQYAIIADSITEVLAEFPNISLIFDSAFSLNNTGEPLSMANPDKETIDAFTYSNKMGANGDGNSLQINEGLAISASPTPGLPNHTTATPPPVDDSDTGTSTGSGISGSSTGSGTSSDSTHSQQTQLTNYTTPTPFKIGAGRVRTIPVRTPVTFEVEINTDLSGVTYEWNFGDMNTRKGRKATHVYEFPGTYNVVLEAKGGDSTVLARTQIHIIEPQIELIQDETSISITNTSSKEFNIGEFVLAYTAGPNSIPQNTIIDAKQTLTIIRRPYEVLEGLRFSDGTQYLQLDFFPMAFSSYIWCSQNTHIKECNPRYITKLFDIIKGWLQ